MKLQTFHSQIYSYLVVTAQLSGHGMIKDHEKDVFVVSFTSVHLSICMYLAEALNMLWALRG